MTPSRLLFPLLLLCALLAGLGSLPARASSTDLLSALGIEASAQPKFLTVDEAFVLESEQQGHQLLLRLRIADDYYLYRHSFRFKGKTSPSRSRCCPPAPSMKMTSSARPRSITGSCRSPSP